jgi:hypothetical protein
MIALPPVSGLTALSPPRPIAQGQNPSPAAPAQKEGASPPALVLGNEQTTPKQIAPGYPSPDYHYDTLTGQIVMEFLNAKSGAPELQIPDSATLRERAASIANYRPADPEPK